MNTMVAKPAAVVATALIAEVTAVVLDVNTIILAVIGLLGTSVTGYLALRMAALSADAKEGKEHMKEMHNAVNSSKTVLENKLDALTSQNAELVKKVATLEENKRGAELAKAVASAAPGVVVLPAVAATAAPVIQAPVAAPPVPPPEATKTIAAIASAVDVAASAPTRIGEAITELKAAAEETSVAADKTVDIVDKQAGNKK